MICETSVVNKWLNGTLEFVGTLKVIIRRGKLIYSKVPFNSLIV